MAHARNSTRCFSAQMFARAATVCVLLLSLSSHTGAQQGVARTQPSIPDIEVFDQNGKKMRFYSDLIAGKVVAVNFIFTSCTFVCPMQGSNFAKLQTALGERLGRDVHLISVSVDPATDTPARLKAWGEKFGVKAGWTLVTGEQASMDKLLRTLTGDATRPVEHSPVVLLGDFDKGGWVRAYGLAEPERYLDLLAKASSAQASKP
ncbi:MAG TPA: SCO family protein [Pyrinomonadaceae bacterium]|nr:SCO family protein [Pyrinomonadaceae bacterium]